MVPYPLLLAVLVGLGVAVTRWRRSSDTGGATTTSGATSTWSTSAGVVLPAGAAGWLDRLATLAAADGLAVHVTSGDRSAAAQAAAMLAKQARYDAAVAAGEEPAWSDDLLKLYSSSRATVEQLQASGRDEAVWAAILEQNPVSPHQGGRALDLRTRDLPGGNEGEGAQRLAELVEQLGGDALVESDHLHVQGSPWSAVA